MIARKSECDAQQLSALLGDTLDEKRQAAVIGHLDHCVRCRQQLERLTANEQWWHDTQHTLRELNFTPNKSLAATQATDLRESADGAQLQGVRGPREHHWVMGLLQPSTDPQALGEIEGLLIQAVVGQGGMGVVLKAWDPRLQRFLAVKLLSPMLAGSGAARQRFFREARAAAAVVHPNIVPIYAVSAERSLPYLVMPYVAGGNLQHVLDNEGPLSLDRSLSIGLQVAEGLIAAHRQGIVHRDIKPANLMLDEGGFRILITDFGLARALDDATLTGSGLLAGTPQYMSPEQARGGVIDHRSDLYSLGAVLYALATGRSPVRGDSTFDILRRIGEEPPKSILEINETYPAWYEQLVGRLMTPAASARPQSAEQVAGLLRAALAHARSPHTVALPKELQPVSQARYHLRVPIASLVIGTLILLAVAALITTWPASFAVRQTSVQQSVVDWVPDIPIPTASAVADAPVHVDPWDSAVLESLLSTSEQELEIIRQEITPLSRFAPRN